MEKNDLRAISLYKRAIDKRCDCSALKSLAKFLQNGADGVENDMARTLFL